MKTFMAGVLAVTALVVGPGMVRAAGTPLVVSYELTSASKEGKTVCYTLRVTNRGDQTISGLGLWVVPSRLLIREKKALEVGDLAPHQSAEISLPLKARGEFGKARLLREPLFISASYRDADGSTVEVAVPGYRGGAR